MCFRRGARSKERVYKHGIPCRSPSYLQSVAIAPGSWPLFAPKTMGTRSNDERDGASKSNLIVLSRSNTSPN